MVKTNLEKNYILWCTTQSSKHVWNYIDENMRLTLVSMAVSGLLLLYIICITHIALFKELNVCSLEEQWLVYSKFKNNKLIINDKPQSRWWRIILGYLNCKLSSTPSNEEVNHSVCRGNDTCKMKPFNIFGMTKQTTHGMKHSWCWSQLKVHKWIVMLSQVSPLIQAEWFFFFNVTC